ncbi:hypothetical protein [Roseibium sediminicola]|uniref:Uncharacterized protein n=1 Tax=Roseibium sediminicola TaxID=2933272 RepID=A0ABT0H275_9HYPH|nr:hypothetical protein [Roseibium sp. CAU 1639]MCK7615178.1 hypothetical protein [Roseibium sp. CAU 1639]
MTPEGRAAVKVASQPGVQRIHAFSGEVIGLDVSEARVRIVDESLDPKLVMTCLTEFERGLLTGRVSAKNGDNDSGT